MKFWTNESGYMKEDMILRRATSKQNIETLWKKAVSIHCSHLPFNSELFSKKKRGRGGSYPYNRPWRPIGL
jgi:hypothetical protein